jgi:hypothetical protein
MPWGFIIVPDPFSEVIVTTGIALLVDQYIGDVVGRISRGLQ